MRPYAIAGIQMQIHYGHNNLPRMKSKLDVLMHRFPWVEMVVFSELAAFGASLDHAQELPGPIEEEFREMAVKHNVWLLPGSVFEKHEGKIYNTCPVIDPRGNVVTRYRKMFPFRPYEKGVTGGDRFVIFDVPEVGRFGVSICYDMWFPETTRTLAAQGVEVILHPSLTDTIDRDIELAIARASAATNQVFFFDVNGVGDGGNGRTSVVRPTGAVIYCAANGEELVPVEIDLDHTRRVREKGLLGLGQTLKSFRDREVEFDVYHPDRFDRNYLESLGPLATPGRRKRDA